MKKLFVWGVVAIAAVLQLRAQSVDVNQPWSVRMAESEMVRCPESWQLDFQPRLKWDYCHGVEMKGFTDLYLKYGNRRYMDYVLAYCDTMTHADGSIVTYRPSELSLDRINSAKLFFQAYKETGDEKYMKALRLVRGQLTYQPRTKEGGFWHKLIYTRQMWLDGLYMAEPFYAEYAARYGSADDFKDIALQFEVVAKHTDDAKSGLFRHAWDESRQQKWADPKTGQSAHCWGRAMGWYAMALVDALEFFPESASKERASMISILETVAKAVKNYQDEKSGLWYQVVDRSGDEGNYLESSASAMFVYSLYKGVRLGLIDKSYLEVAEKGYQGILTNFIEVEKSGVINLTRACAVAGLGGTPYRSGDYQYYINEKIRSNDPKAVGPFILASLEYETLHPFVPAKQKKATKRNRRK